MKGQQELCCPDGMLHLTGSRLRVSNAWETPLPVAVCLGGVRGGCALVEWLGSADCWGISVVIYLGITRLTGHSRVRKIVASTTFGCVGSSGLGANCGLRIFLPTSTECLQNKRKNACLRLTRFSSRSSASKGSEDGDYDRAACEEGHGRSGRVASNSRLAPCLCHHLSGRLRLIGSNSFEAIN